MNVHTELKPCPFCGYKNLDLSIKTKGDYYHCVIYCKSCRAYGPRTILKLDQNEHLYGPIRVNEKTLSKHNIREKAAEAWNSRSIE